MRRTVFLLALTALGTVLLPAPHRAAANPLTGIVAISAGGDHTCALTTAGGVKCWGSNAAGQLGIGTSEFAPHPTPVDVHGLTSGVAAISVGYLHTCAVTTAGALLCWGSNYHGQLGTGDVGSCPDPLFGGEVPCSTIPLPVVGLESNAAAVAAGDGHTCAVTTDGALKCWGWNYMGHLGDGTTTPRATPVDVAGLASGVAAVSAGYSHTCALTTEGGVKCWGGNSSGKLGAESTQLCEDIFTGALLPCSTTPLDVTGLASGVAVVSAGSSHTCALTTVGSVKCWGVNQVGQLGEGRRCGVACRAPVDVCADAACAAPLSGVAAVEAEMHFHTCAFTTGGTVKCWGVNFKGMLGDGTTTDRTTPVHVCEEYDDEAGRCLTVLSGVAAVAVGGFHACALREDGGIECWGSNCCGQLGNGTSDFDAHAVPEGVVEAFPKPTPTPPLTSTPMATLTPTPTQIVTPTPTVSPAAPGDANCDGAVSTLDALLVLQLEASLIPSLPCRHAADMNGDGAANSLDAAVILQLVAGVVGPRAAGNEDAR